MEFWIAFSDHSQIDLSSIFVVMTGLWIIAFSFSALLPLYILLRKVFRDDSRCLIQMLDFDPLSVDLTNTKFQEKCSEGGISMINKTKANLKELISKENAFSCPELKGKALFVIEQLEPDDGVEEVVAKQESLYQTRSNKASYETFILCIKSKKSRNGSGKLYNILLSRACFQKELSLPHWFAGLFGTAIFSYFGGTTMIVDAIPVLKQLFEPCKLSREEIQYAQACCVRNAKVIGSAYLQIEGKNVYYTPKGTEVVPSK